MAEQAKKLDEILGPTAGHWLEYGLIPLLTLLSISGLGLAIWSGLAGSVPGFPITFIIIYLSFSAFCGTYLTALYRSERAYGPSRILEPLLLALIALGWQWICAPIMGHHPSPLPVTGLGSGIHPSVLLFLIAGGLWGIGHILGVACSRSWPGYQPIKRIDWLPDTDQNAPTLPEECDIIGLEQGRKDHALTIILCMILTVLLTIIRPERHMQHGSAFFGWGVLQVVTGLLSISFYTLLGNRRTWRERKANIDSSVTGIWHLATVMIITIALLVGTLLTTASPQRAFFEFHKPAAERLDVPNKIYQNNSLDDTKAKAKDLSKRSKLEAKASKDFTLPKGVRIVGSILMMVLFICFVTATILLALSFGVIILILIIRLIPGLMGFASLRTRSDDKTDLTLLGKLLVPLSIVADLLTASGLEALSFLKSLTIRNRLRKRDDTKGIDKKDGDAKGRLISRGLHLKPHKLNIDTPSAVVRDLYIRFIKRAGKMGYTLEKHETPREFIARFPQEPGLNEHLDKLTTNYEHVRYGQPKFFDVILKSFEDNVKQIINRMKSLTRK